MSRTTETPSPAMRALCNQDLEILGRSSGGDIPHRAGTGITSSPCRHDAPLAPPASPASPSRRYVSVRILLTLIPLGHG